MRDGGPPGKMVYDSEGYSVWEVDGEEYKVGFAMYSCWGLLMMGDYSFSPRTCLSLQSSSWITSRCFST